MKRLIGGQPLYTKNENSFSNATVLAVGNSGGSVTYQIRTVHGNIGVLKDSEIEESFNLHPTDVVTTEPVVGSTPKGFLLTVDVVHAENIKRMVPEDLYDFEISESLGAFYVSRNEWNRFSDLLSL